MSDGMLIDGLLTKDKGTLVRLGCVAGASVAAVGSAGVAYSTAASLGVVSLAPPLLPLAAIAAVCGFAAPKIKSLIWPEAPAQSPPSIVAPVVGELRLEQYGRLWTGKRKLLAEDLPFIDRMVASDTEKGLCLEMCKLAGLDAMEIGQVALDVDFNEPGAAHLLCLHLRDLVGDSFEFDMAPTPLPVPPINPSPEP